jgi:pentatricopeptide repeat protein
MHDKSIQIILTPPTKTHTMMLQRSVPRLITPARRLLAAGKKGGGGGDAAKEGGGDGKKGGKDKDDGGGAKMSAIDAKVAELQAQSQARLKEFRENDPWKEMFKFQKKDDKITFTPALIKAYADRGKVDQVAKLMENWKKYKHQYYPPSILSYNTLLSVYFRAGYPERALDLFENMKKKKKLYFNQHTYENMIRGLISATSRMRRNLKDQEKWYSDLEEKAYAEGVDPPPKPEPLKVVDYLPRAKDIFHEMRGTRCLIPMEVYARLIMAHASGLPDTAEDVVVLWNQFTNERPVLQPDCDMLRVVAKAFIALRDHKHAIDVFNHWRIVSFGADATEGERLLQDIVNLCLDADDLESAWQAFLVGMYPNERTQEKLLAAFCRKRFMQHAKKIWKDVQQIPTIKMFNSMLSGYISSNDFEAATEIYQELLHNSDVEHNRETEQLIKRLHTLYPESKEIDEMYRQAYINSLAYNQAEQWDEEEEAEEEVGQDFQMRNSVANTFAQMSQERSVAESLYDDVDEMTLLRHSSGYVSKK